MVRVIEGSCGKAAAAPVSSRKARSCKPSDTAAVPSARCIWGWVDRLGSLARAAAWASATSPPM